MASTDAGGQSRPSMRRKSSAQTLLNTFKSSANNPPPTAPASQLSMQIPPTVINSGHGGASTPVSTTQREWDTQSMKSDSVSSSTPLGQGNANGSPALIQGTSVESLRDLVTKRMITLTYLRNVHEGSAALSRRSHWFNTVMMTRADLDRVFSNTLMKRRTLSFAILGMSLSGIFDNTNANDLMKSLLNILTEHEQSKEENYKPKMRFFKSNKMPRRQTNAMNDYAMTVPEANEASFLVMPHVPFPLDYHQTLLSLLDILSEVYHRLSKILGPSPFPHSGQYMMGPLGVLTPHPGVSYLFQGVEGTQTHDADGNGSLWGIANGAGIGAGPPAGSGMMSPPASWTPVIGDTILKIDGKLKRIIGQLLKELDQFARNAIKDELASLDPLLRNQAVSDNGREQFDFDFGF
ncbi:hypothetical protein EW145_g1622 [Phellinidium pouzarii]|uniref:Uncharacterized protein n=1 Tax=Phellinidium pouzarii TaxID=167371 RepID=A0A4V3XDJ4_9AGAM|nr:hypothetical protein EW145_g1622 [Phellinidium pouzarii]